MSYYYSIKGFKKLESLKKMELIFIRSKKFNINPIKQEYRISIIIDIKKVYISSF
jgi:hypothetical protein